MSRERRVKIENSRYNLIMKNNVIKIYTDGAAKGNPGRAGWGAVFLAGNKIFEIGGGVEHATNNQMELTAPIEAMKYLKSKMSKRHFDIEIVSDSKYVILGITEWIFNWQKNNKKEKGIYKKGQKEKKHKDRADLIATSFAEGEPVKLTNKK